jgi:hypothetical protein
VSTQRCTSTCFVVCLTCTRLFWPRNPAYKLTRSAAARLLVSFVSVALKVVRKGTNAIFST